MFVVFSPQITYYGHTLVPYFLICFGAILKHNLKCSGLIPDFMPGGSY